MLWQEFYSTWTETPQQVTGRQLPSAPAPALIQPADWVWAFWLDFGYEYMEYVMYI